MPGCCRSFTVLPPAVFCPRPSCQVKFPPVRRLSWCLKSSGRALYSTAGLQKLKLEAARKRQRRGGSKTTRQPWTLRDFKTKGWIHYLSGLTSLCYTCSINSMQAFEIQDSGGTITCSERLVSRCQSCETSQFLIITRKPAGRDPSPLNSRWLLHIQ